MDYILSKSQSDLAKMNYINIPGTSTDIYGPTGFVEAGLGFQDKRNRNPNWTDHEINRFLEMLQEDDTIKDLVANRNKKASFYSQREVCSVYHYKATRTIIYIYIYIYNLVYTSYN